MQNNISTERLNLDLLTLNDHAFILELVNTEGWKKFIGDRNVHSREDAIAYINKILAAENLFYWVARKKDDNIPVGIISFIKRAYLDNFDIGFAFLPAFMNYGYAYEAANAILCLMGKDYNPILATTIPGNINSIRLLNKLGLLFEKELSVKNEILHIYSTAAKFKQAAE